MNSLPLLLLYFVYAASPIGNHHAENAWDAYLTGNFDLVESLVEEAIKDSSLSDAELGLLYLSLGNSLAMQGRDEKAAAAFRKALHFDRFADLTSADLPPPVWKIFDPTRRAFVASVEVERDRPKFQPPHVQSLVHDTVVVYRDLPTDRTSNLKSLAFPGWGHLNNGQKRGLYYLGAEATFLTVFVLSAVKMNAARDDYLKSRTQDEIDARYDDYNNYYRLTWGFGLAAAATYLLTQYDFFTFHDVRITGSVELAP